MLLVSSHDTSFTDKHNYLLLLLYLDHAELTLVAQGQEKRNVIDRTKKQQHLNIYK